MTGLLILQVAKDARHEPPSQRLIRSYFWIV